MKPFGGIAASAAAIAAALVFLASVMPALFGEWGWEFAAILAVNVVCIGAAGAASELNARDALAWSVLAALVPVLLVAGFAASIIID